MYIKDQRVRSKRALYQGGPGIAGLGGASDCGAGQIWDPNFVYGTLPPGQCVTQAQSDANRSAHPEQYGATSSNGGFTDVLSATIGAVGKIFGQQPAPVVVAPSSGINTTTVLVLGGLGLGAILLLTRKGS